MRKFRVTKCVDAYVHYDTIVEADDAEKARQLAEENEGDYIWSRGEASEYDDRDFNNIDPELVADDTPAPEETIELVVSVRERDMILAGLRAYQRLYDMTAGDVLDELLDIAQNGREDGVDEDDGAALSLTQIDALCERINF